MSHYKHNPDELPVLYWRNYTYKEGTHIYKGTEYFRDRECTDLYARDPWRAQKKDRMVRLNYASFKTIKAGI